MAIKDSRALKMLASNFLNFFVGQIMAIKDSCALKMIASKKLRKVQGQGLDFLN
jgi:hypothetical protein